MVNVIKQREWTEAELRSEGFSPYKRKKELIMVRRLPKSEAPKQITIASGETLIASVGDMICYQPGAGVRPTLDDYPHWPVDPIIFWQTYSAWDQPDWRPSEPEQHLLKLGCLPYYKIGEVWAKKLDHPAYVQSLEQKTPERVNQGRYLIIGAKGEPYSMGSTTFWQRYYPEGLRLLWQRIRNLFNHEQGKGEKS